MNSAMLLGPPATEVASILRQSQLPDLRLLSVEEDDSEIVLTGSVSTYYLKQLAQETIRPAVRLRRVRNRVVVSAKK